MKVNVHDIDVHYNIPSRITSTFTKLQLYVSNRNELEAYTSGTKVNDNEMRVHVYVVKTKCQCNCSS